MSRRTLALTAMAGLVLAAAGTAGAAGALGKNARHDGATRHDGDRTAEVRSSIQGGRADNVILLIGDGLGDSEITATRNYQHGASGSFPGIDALPLTGQYTTYSLKKDGTTDYVPDSAATGSACSATATSRSATPAPKRRSVAASFLPPSPGP